MKDHRNYTLGELMDFADQTIYRNAMSIHKRLTQIKKILNPRYPKCNDCTEGVTVYETTKEGTCPFCGRQRN